MIIKSLCSFSLKKQKNLCPFKLKNLINYIVLTYVGTLIFFWVSGPSKKKVLPVSFLQFILLAWLSIFFLETVQSWTSLIINLNQILNF